MNDLCKEFYIKNYDYIISEEGIDVSFAPMMIRRKLSLTDKLALTVMQKVLKEPIDEVIFSSQYGEIDRLVNIINQYKDENEISPIAFSSSVHNYANGVFFVINKLNCSYNAISAGEKSLSAGLISACISAKKNILFCYCDSKPTLKSVSCLISKEKSANSICCKISKPVKNSCDEFSSFIKFLEGKSEAFATENCSLTRILT
jgi:hypothetical protein